MTTDNDKKQEIHQLSDGIRSVEARINEAVAKLRGIEEQKEMMVKKLQELCDHPESLVVTSKKMVDYGNGTPPVERDVSICGFCKKITVHEPKEDEEEGNNNEN